MHTSPLQSTKTDNNLPLISVIVPVYNVAPYLHLCIDTILQQTYSNLEIILVASESTDGSVEICDSYLTKDSRVSIIHTPAEGLSKARNVGIDFAKGEYLIFIDSDDFIAPDFITTLYTLLIDSKSDIAQCDFIHVPQETTNGDAVYTNSIKLVSGRDMCYNFYDLELGYTTVVAWSKIYHRKLFEGIRYPVGRLHEDVATTHKLFYRANQVAVTRSKLYFYRQVETSIMGRPWSLKRLDTLRARQERMDFFKEMGDDELYSFARADMVSMINSVLLNVKKLSDTEDIQKQLISKRDSLVWKVLVDRNVPIVRRGHAVIGSYFPRTTRMIVKLFRKLNLIGN